MKMQERLKRVFYFSFMALFLSGVVYFICEILESDFDGTRMWSLRIHSIIGLWFFFLFGHLYSVHIRPKLRRSKGRKTGFVFFGSIIILCLTVPGLFYITNDEVRESFAIFHTYLGLALLVPFVLHSVLKIDGR